MNASDDTPQSGENVSDAQFDQQEELKQYVTNDISFVIDALRQDTLTPGTTLSDQLQAVRQARYRLKLTEAVLEDQLGDNELRVKLCQSREGMRQ